MKRIRTSKGSAMASKEIKMVVLVANIDLYTSRLMPQSELLKYFSLCIMLANCLALLRKITPRGIANLLLCMYNEQL